MICKQFIVGINFSDRNEKIVLRYLCVVCSGKRTYLISPHDIAKASSNKIVLSLSEIDEIMTKLSLQNYIDFVVSDSKNGYYYCVKLKQKGKSYIVEEFAKTHYKSYI